jgi:nitric oxide reductase subunit B
LRWAISASGCSPSRLPWSWLYLVIQTGAGTIESIWFINEGREYIEAPRWADIGIVVCVLIFFYNVAATFMKGRWTGIGGVLVLDLVAVAGMYLTGMFYSPNLSMDQFWWWWVIHLWVEATWEVLVGCIMAWGLIKTLGARRQVVTTWLYIEVALMLGSGILGPRSSLLLDRHAGILAHRRWFLLGTRAGTAGSDGRARGL